MTAEPLLGGVANRGRIYRVGNTVRRPLAPHRTARHALLAHLAAVGFTGSPRVLPAVDAGEVLSWIAGSAGYTPLPDWALTDESMVSVARLVRGLHDAAANFDPTPYAWPDEHVPAPYRTSVISHNDLHPGNVVYRNGLAVGIIDYDLAGPGGVIWDLAAMTRCWCPLLADEDVPTYLRDRRVERFVLMLDAYGLDPHRRVEVVEALLPNQEWTYRIVTDNADAGHEGFQAFWDLVRGRVQRGHGWITDHRADLAEAVCG